MDDDEVMDMVNDEIQAYRKEKNEREQEWKDRIEYYKESKKKISKQLEGKKGRDKEYVENRMKSLAISPNVIVGLFICTSPFFLLG